MDQRGDPLVTALRAAVLLPEGERQNAELVLRCLNHITAAGYIFDSIVSDWGELMEMRRREIIQVVVYARPEHIDLAGLPRFELAGEVAQPAAEEVPDSTRSRRQRQRPKLVQR